MILIFWVIFFYLISSEKIEKNHENEKIIDVKNIYNKIIYLKQYALSKKKSNDNNGDRNFRI